MEPKILELQDVTKAVLKGKSTLNAYSRKEEKFQIASLMLQLINYKKSMLIPNSAEHCEILKITTQINETEIRKTTQELTNIKLNPKTE